MPLNNSGPISLGGATSGQSVNLELGKGATDTISMNDTNVRTLAGVPTGPITFNNFYGKSNVSSPTPTPTRTPSPSLTPSVSVSPTPTPTITPSATRPTYPRYSVTYCNGSTGTVISSTALSVGSVYELSGNCFTVDSEFGTSAGTPSIFTFIPDGCADTVNCVQQ